MAAGSPSTFELAAKLGVGVLCFAFTPPQVLTPLIAKYKEMIEDCTDPVGAYVNNNVMITSQLMCMEDGARARQAFLTADTSFHLSLVFRYLDTFPKPKGIPDWPATIPEATAENVEDMISSGSVAIGDPEEVARSVQTFVDTGADQLAFGMLSSSIERETCVEVVETFGKHVLPQFDKDPVHSTTRQREAQLTKS
jgi:alkanesulfonate monooxygenase SsuD/methylene tetrahydromethanopterin reductase-like flavin-dependent oxidoreductase (luciferase family)